MILVDLSPFAALPALAATIASVLLSIDVDDLSVPPTRPLAVLACSYTAFLFWLVVILGVLS